MGIADRVIQRVSETRGVAIVILFRDDDTVTPADVVVSASVLARDIYNGTGYRPIVCPVIDESDDGAPVEIIMRNLKEE